MKTALICGVTGQDGSYLAQFLIGMGYVVWGTSRDRQTANFANLRHLGIDERVNKLSMDPSDFRSILEAVDRSSPSEIYNLAGQTSVGLSFEQPAAALVSIATATLNMLEVIRFLKRPVRYYNAGSSECFGDTGLLAANEAMPFQPRSPYAVAKSTAHWLVDNYRAAYGIKACTGILFNHESVFRPRRFVTRKIVEAALDIAEGKTDRLFLGNLDIERDWGWSIDYVQAMWRMLQLDDPEDLVIATGSSYPLRDFVACAFAEVGKDWSDHVALDESLIRRTDIMHSRGDPSRAADVIGWTAQTHMHAVVKRMVAELRHERELLKRSVDREGEG